MSRLLLAGLITVAMCAPLAAHAASVIPPDPCDPEQHDVLSVSPADLQTAAPVPTPLSANWDVVLGIREPEVPFGCTSEQCQVCNNNGLRCSPVSGACCCV